jgi:hypothetical protein
VPIAHRLIEHQLAEEDTWMNLLGGGEVLDLLA